MSFFIHILVSPVASLPLAIPPAALQPCLYYLPSASNLSSLYSSISPQFPLSCLIISPPACHLQFSSPSPSVLLPHTITPLAPHHHHHSCLTLSRSSRSTCLVLPPDSLTTCYRTAPLRPCPHTS